MNITNKWYEDYRNAIHDYFKFAFKDKDVYVLKPQLQPTGVALYVVLEDCTTLGYLISYTHDKNDFDSICMYVANQIEKQL